MAEPPFFTDASRAKARELADNLENFDPFAEELQRQIDYRNLPGEAFWRAVFWDAAEIVASRSIEDVPTQHLIRTMAAFGQGALDPVSPEYPPAAYEERPE